jgi:hypothetical protein
MRSKKKVEEALERIFDIVWWNRHKVLEEEYKRTGKYPSDKIWKEALQQAARIEKYIPANELTMSDFDWGMVNGKFSALRWVLGCEWDDLGT